MNTFRQRVMSLRSLPLPIRLAWPLCALACLSSVGIRDSAAVWVEQIDTIQGYLTVVQAVNHDVVWAAGYQGRVVVTTNGGVNWAIRTVPGAGRFNGLYAFNSQEAVVADGTGRFWRTTDGGVQWVPVHGPTGSSVNGIHFFDEQNGWAMGDPVNGQFVIVLSTDGGWSWSPAPNAPPAAFGVTGQVRSYDWIGSQVCVFTIRQWVLWRTTNAGADWDSVRTDIYMQNGVELSDSGVGLASGHDGNGMNLLRRSTDSGATWSPGVHPPQATSMRNFDWIEGTDEVWGATNQTGVFQSTNTGIDWVRHTIGQPFEFSVGDLDFIDQNTGWCVGGVADFAGHIYRWSTTAGVTLSPATTPHLDVMAYPNPFRSELILEIATSSRTPAEWAVYDVIGHKIWSSVTPAGAARQQWDGRDRSGRLVPSGAYFYKVQAGAQESTGRIVKVP